MNLFGIEIKPGMTFNVDNYCSDNLYIVFPRKNKLAVVAYGQQNYWVSLDEFIKEFKNRIVCIKDIGIGNQIDDGQILWQYKLKVKLSKKDIAKKFNLDLPNIEIEIID